MNGCQPCSQYYICSNQVWQSRAEIFSRAVALKAATFKKSDFRSYEKATPYL